MKNSNGVKDVPELGCALFSQSEIILPISEPAMREIPEGRRKRGAILNVQTAHPALITHHHFSFLECGRLLWGTFSWNLNLTWNQDYLTNGVRMFELFPTLNPINDWNS